jgi:hypothetical protein
LGWRAGWLTGWLACWLAGLLAGWLAGWLAGVDCLDAGVHRRFVLLTLLVTHSLYATLSNACYGVVACRCASRLHGSVDHWI